MPDGTENPYRSDVPGQGPYFGRVEEQDRLLFAIRSGRQGIAAVMGGRGMGKTSLALRLQRELSAHDPDVRPVLIRRPQARPEDFVVQLGIQIGVSLDATMVVESLVESVEELPVRRLVAFIDEVEALVTTRDGRALLDNLRIAYEALGGKLGIVVFGGASLRQLLESETSAFLRTAEWIPLRGLTQEETGQLMREPLGLTFSEDVIETVWSQTGGHPLLLQRVLETAVAFAQSRASRPERELPDALVSALERHFAPVLFPIWWDNLAGRARQVWAALARTSGPVARTDRLAVLGPAAHPLAVDPLVEVLEATGVARDVGGVLLPSCSLFQTWVEQSFGEGIFPRAHDVEPTPDIVPDAPAFERLVVQAVALWCRTTLEFPAWCLKSGGGSGNPGLLPEQHFQLSLLTALRQRDLMVEAEALSSARGRADLKVRFTTGAERACVELKIWGRNDYREAVRQVLGYAVPEDTFAAVVMVDRQRRPLAVEYRSTCLATASPRQLFPAEAAGEAAPGQPSLVTEHPRDGGPPIRVYHFLVQLPATE